VLRGRLLVASPTLGDPNFERTVILLIEHGDEGALGLVLNRTSPMRVDEVLPGWADLATRPEVMFLGGPVQPNAVICLGRADEEIEGIVASSAVPGIGLVDLDADPAGAVLDGGLRCFAGYAGWSAAQLESEITEGAWFVVEPAVSDPFSPEPRDLWRSVLSRQPDNLARYALYPDDVTAN
jgi:putative transcriptional regulator